MFYKVAGLGHRMMLHKHFRWTVVQSVPRGTPDKLQQFRLYLHVCDSRHFRSIRKHFSLCFWKFWMTENHLRSHFSPFHINTQLYFLEFCHKMAAGVHFGRDIDLKIKQEIAVHCCLKVLSYHKN